MPKPQCEMFELIDERGRLIGIAPRHCCHSNPALRHRATQVLVFATDGRILLQKRSARKDIQAGKDSAVGGHLQIGEDFASAACREMAEEIGLHISPAELELLFDLRIHNQREHELVRVFAIESDGPFYPQLEEIDELRFWTWDEIDAALDKAIFTPNLEREFALLRKRPKT